jgi:hypothetical protein
MPTGKLPSATKQILDAKNQTDRAVAAVRSEALGRGPDQWLATFAEPHRPILARLRCIA